MGRRTRWRVVVLLTASAALACGKSDAPASPSGSPVSGTTITITASGANPRRLSIARGSQVTFVNNDRVVHQMYSDPHPEHTDCPEFDSVGQLAPGQTRQTTNLVTARTCSFHDHL